MRASTARRIAAGLASRNVSSPVSAASAQPRSGSGVFFRKSRTRTSLALREAVKERRSSRWENARIVSEWQSEPLECHRFLGAVVQTPTDDSGARLRAQK